MKKITPNDLKEQISKEKTKQIIEDLAIRKMKEMYGDVVDSRIINRLLIEVDELSKICDLNSIIEVAEVIKAKKEQSGSLYLSRLSHSNSFLFYLLGLGGVNPLPRHAYCLKCHTFHWGKRKTNECDCCGAYIEEDGYDLPFEPLLDEIRRNGLRFDFSSTKSGKHVAIPIRYYESDLIKLAKELGMTQEALDDPSINEKDLEKIIKCLSSTKTDEKISYYTNHYKKISVCEHLPFIGIPDLGQPVLRDMLGAWSNVFKDDNFIKVMNMFHGTGVYDGNIALAQKTCCGDTKALEKCITSRDELYQFLIKSQLRKDDALLICRETRLCGKGHLSKLSECKLKEAGVEDEYINFMKHISYIFHKGHMVAHTRLAIKIAKIYLEEPLRYYKALFTINKEKLLKMNKNYDFIKGLSEFKSTDMEEVYLAAIDLIERGYDPKQLIVEVLNN